MGNIYSGRYTEEEVQLIKNINMRPHQIKKPVNPFYRKDDMENNPTWR